MHVLPAKLTRHCLDPWRYLEVTPEREVKPCCKYASLPGPADEDCRESGPFRVLRERLLSGDLDATCRSCHIRPMATVETLQKDVEDLLGRNGETDLARAGPLAHLRIDVTGRCNLRCTYCPVSQPNYQASDLEVAAFDEILSLVARAGTAVDVLVNGHGETTYHPHWLRLCQGLVGLGSRLQITTNLAKPLAPEEAECLSHFSVVQVSLDTVDPDLLARVRRKVKLSTICANLEAIRAAAARYGASGPAFAISCGVYDLSYPGLEDLARFAIETKMTGVTFWQLVKYPDVPDALNVQPIPSLEPRRIVEAIRSLEHACSMLREAGITAEVAGGFLEDWRPLALAAA